MPRSEIDLDPYKQEITRLYRNKTSTEEISKFLKRAHDVKVSQRTLKRRLREWQISQRIPIPDNPQLRARMSTLFYEHCANDKEILHILQKEGVAISQYGVETLRQRIGLRRRVSRFDREEADEQLYEIVQKELDKGTIGGFGRGFLYNYFRNQMHCVAR
jgi:Clr5-like protein